MIARKAIAGLALLSALLFCALAAQGAAAQIGHTSENTTAFTCVKGGGSLDFADEHCDETVEVGKGKFGHELIPGGKTEIEITNKATKGKTLEAHTATLKTKLLGVEGHISCLTVEGSGTIENGGTGTDHKVTGTVEVKYKDCTVLKPLNCKVKEPILAKATFMGVDKLESNGLKETMGVEFVEEKNEKGEGLSFAELAFEGEKCALKGKTFPVTGSAIGTPGNTEGGPSPSARESGATMKFEGAPESKMETLKIGLEPAEFNSVVTTRMKGGGNPIALTTTT